MRSYHMRTMPRRRPQLSSVTPFRGGVTDHADSTSVESFLSQSWASIRSRSEATLDGHTQYGSLPRFGRSEQEHMDSCVFESFR